MLDVNLGNKTLVVGVLIALILSYGMINFDSGSPQNQGNVAIRAALQNVSSDEATISTASSSPEGLPAESVESSAAGSPAQAQLGSSSTGNTLSERQLIHDRKRAERM